MQTEDSDRLLNEIRKGNSEAMNELFMRHRAYLRKVVDLRMEARLRKRMDPSDIVQDAMMEAVRRIDDYVEKRPMPMHLWLRWITCEMLIRMRRRHGGAQMRSVDLEVPLPRDTSIRIARNLLDKEGTPSAIVTVEEMALKVRRAVALLEEDDREIILMRNFEHLSNAEAAQALGMASSAASKRYARALLRLHKLLTDDGLTGSQVGVQRSVESAARRARSS